MVKKTKLCYVDKKIYITTDDTSEDFAEDIETRFDTSNYELDRPIAKGKTKM